MMRRAERTLTELYSLTEKITEPEITPILEGYCRIQGPVDESDDELRRTNSGTFQADKKFAFINNSFHMRVESGTCNVCSAPCSSCMHNNRTLLAMESNIECGSSQNSCATKEVDSCSFICAEGMACYKSRTCDERATSEASNLVSASSSHDSDFENAESKATVRVSAACEGPEDVGMPPFEPLRAAVEDQIVQENKSDMDDCLFSSISHLTSDLCHSTSTNNDKQRGLECRGDNISCINKDSNSNIGHGKMHLDMKNARCTTLTDILLPQSVENTMHVEPTYFSHGHENVGRQSSHGKAITSHEELFQKKHADSTNSFSFKSDFAEVHHPSHYSSPKIQSLHSPSRNGYVACHSGDCMDSDGSSDCQPCIDGESLLGTELAVATDGQKKIPDTCMENENALGEVIKSRNVNDKLETPSYLVEAPTIQEHPPQLQQVMEGSETELTDIKVCDICGDAGREELLAVCSRCSDGAEHTYCMRKMMRKIPEGNWLCEECQLKDDAVRKMVDMPENLSNTAKECKVANETEIKNVDRLEKLSETTNDCILKEHAEGKKGVMSEAVSRISKICKQDVVENNKKVDKSETVPGTPKPTCPRMANLKVLPKLDVKAVDQDMRRVPRGLQSPKISAKKHAEIREVMSYSSKKTQEITGQCIEIDNPRKKPALSRESSFKKFDTGKAKVLNMPTSKGGQSPNSPQGFSCPQSMLGSHLPKVQAQLHPPHGQRQPPHGLLTHSISFNNLSLKPKVKQLTESVHVKPKIARESSFNDTRKKALARSMTKSASFKDTAASSNTESASKTQFIHSLRVEDPRCLKQRKERNKMEKKTSVVDRLPTNSSPRAGTITPHLKMGIKTAPHDVKLKNNTSQQNIHRASKGSDDANGLVRNETTKHPISSAKSLGSASLNAKGNSGDQRLCQTPREGARGSSSSNDKFYSIAVAVQHQNVVQSAGSIHRDDKTKDPSIFSNSRQSGSVGNRILCCQRCNESGHATQFCSIDKVRSSALKPLAEKNSKDGNQKRNKWKYAAQTTISNNRLQKKNGQNDRDQSEEFPIYSAEPSSEVGSKDFPSGSSNHPIESPLVVQTYDGQEEISKSLDDDCMTIDHGIDVGQQSFPLAKASCTPSAVQAMETFCTPEPGHLNATTSDELNTNHFLHISPDQASVPANPCRSSAIPKLEFIWQGTLEVLTTENEHASFDGIQAHLSASASPKVLEVATKLPCRVQLEEVSWISSWPLQFQGVSPDEQNIALFFFATDVESYERSYSKLLEKILKNDLVLRGFINGVELLIFPSTKLPVHSQRWNRLFFLWGIFKRRADSLTSKLSSGKRPSGSILGWELAIHDLPCALRSVMPDSRMAFSVEVPDNKPARCDIPSDAMVLKSITPAETWTVASAKVEDGMCRAQDSVVRNSFQLAAYNSLPSEQSPYLFPISHSPSNENQFSNLLSAHLGSRSLVADSIPCSEVKTDDSYRKHLDFRETHGNPSAQLPATNENVVLGSASTSYCTYNDCRKGTGWEGSGKGLVEEKMKSEDIFYGESQRNLIAIDQLSWEKSNRKRVRSCSMEAISQASRETSKSISETVLWKDDVDNNGREQKRAWFREVDASSCLREETLSARLSSKVHPMLASFLGEQEKEYRDVDSAEGVISDNSIRQAERFFFQVQPSPVQSTHSENLVHILSSDDEDAPESDSPDLELALGGKWRTQKKRKKEEQAEDDVSASLSLSLAISTPNKEWSKHISNSAQHLQNRPDLNTPLLSFDGFTDT